MSDFNIIYFNCFFNTYLILKNLGIRKEFFLINDNFLFFFYFINNKINSL